MHHFELLQLRHQGRALDSDSGVQTTWRDHVALGFNETDFGSLADQVPMQHSAHLQRQVVWGEASGWQAAVERSQQGLEARAVGG